MDNYPDARSINWMGRNLSELVLDCISGIIYVHQLRIIYFLQGI